MKYSNSIKGSEITAFVDASLYSKEVIYKCLYWYGDKFTTNISYADQSTYVVTLKTLATASIDNNDLLVYLQKFERDLIDFELRDLINKETGNVRDLLIAKAFSNGEFEEQPVGEVSDPVGFIPMN